MQKINTHSHYIEISFINVSKWSMWNQQAPITIHYIKDKSLLMTSIMFWQYNSQKISP